MSLRGVSLVRDNVCLLLVDGGPFDSHWWSWGSLKRSNVTQIVWKHFCSLNYLIIQGLFLNSWGWVIPLSLSSSTLSLSPAGLKSPCYKSINLFYCCSNMTEILEGKNPISHLCCLSSTSIPNTSLRHSSLQRMLRWIVAVIRFIIYWDFSMCCILC